MVGYAVGTVVGMRDGRGVGDLDGLTEGIALGCCDVGDLDGLSEGIALGCCDGLSEG